MAGMFSTSAGEIANPGEGAKRMQDSVLARVGMPRNKSANGTPMKNPYGHSGLILGGLAGQPQPEFSFKR